MSDTAEPTRLRSTRLRSYASHLEDAHFLGVLPGAGELEAERLHDLDHDEGREHDDDRGHVHPEPMTMVLTRGGPQWAATVEEAVGVEPGALQPEYVDEDEASDDDRPHLYRVLHDGSYHLVCPHGVEHDATHDCTVPWAHGEGSVIGRCKVQVWAHELDYLLEPNGNRHRPDGPPLGWPTEPGDYRVELGTGTVHLIESPTANFMPEDVPSSQPNLLSRALAAETRMANALTEEEHALVALLRRCAESYTAVLRDDEQRRAAAGVSPTDLSNDVAEFVAHVHDLQARVMARAASRLYPELYRP